MKETKYVRTEAGIIVWNKEFDNLKYKISTKKIDLIMIGDYCNAKKVIKVDKKYIYLEDGSKIMEDEIITHSAIRKI